MLFYSDFDSTGAMATAFLPVTAGFKNLFRRAKNYIRVIDSKHGRVISKTEQEKPPWQVPESSADISPVNSISTVDFLPRGGWYSA